MKLNRRKIARVVLSSILGILVVFALYLVLLGHPGLFFRYSFTQGGITMYSDEPIPPEAAGRVLDIVEHRLARSPLATPDRLKDLRIYICNRGWRYVLFANLRYKTGGLAYSLITDNIFLREAHFEANRLVNYSGREVPGERTLSYYIGHEITHVLLARALGALKQWGLPVWKNEGYADLVAKGGDFEYERARELLRRGDRELDPKRSGLYLRYHLLVAYLLEHRGISVAEMLTREFDPARLEAEILAPEGRDGS